MILSEAQLREWSDEITLKRAKQYYEGGYVENLKIVERESSEIKGSKTIEIRTNVISFNGFSSYLVQIIYDYSLNQIFVGCSCPDFENRRKENGGMCKHILAALLKYIREYQDFLALSSEKSSFKPTSDIDTLLEQLKTASEKTDEYKRELNLHIKFTSAGYREKPNVEFKLGLEKPYVVKGMKNFLDAVSRGDEYEFGKNFIYNPEIHKFNEVDQKLLDMLMEIREMDEERNSYDYYSYHSSSLFNGKKLLLTDRILYRFFMLAANRKIDVQIDGNEYKEVEIIQDKMPVKFKLGMKNETIELEQLGELPIPIDNHYKVFWFEGKMYIPPNEQAALYAPLHRLITKRNSQKAVFSKSEGDKVASYLLPKLKVVAEEIAYDKKIRESFYEAPLAIKVFLDKEDSLVTALLKFCYDDIEINPLEVSNKSNNQSLLIRDVDKEAKCEIVLKSFGFEPQNNKYIMASEKDIVSFISDGVNKLQELGEVYYSESFRDIKVYGKSSLKGGVRLNEDNLLEFSFEFEGIDRSELKSIFAALREKKKYYRLKDGAFVSLEDKAIKDLGEMIEFLDIKDKDLLKDKILLSKYNALYLDQKIKDTEMDYVKRSKGFRELTNNIKDVKDMDYTIPESLDSIMRNYQKVGFKWFKTLAAYGFGGILADEMGLGKTLQTIAFLLSEKGDKPSLVIAPTSLLYNWQDEIDKFAPELKAVVVSGSKNQREELMNDIKDCDIVITSYPLIRRDIEDYENINFNYCILDEAQQIKNPASMNASSVKQIKAKGYFALTGTPIENSLTELWSIFDFIMPNYLLSLSKFGRLYETPIIKNGDKNALEELNKHIKPFILRRLKKDVIKELPPKIEQKLVVEMTEEQKKLYMAYVSSAKNEIDDEISSKGFNKSKIKILSILTRLRQICCDPSVFVDDYMGDSGKMAALDDLIEESIEAGHKILLFSQFTSVLKNISRRFNKSHINYMYLDGNTKSEQRMKMVKDFNEGEAKVFLISLKAGGTGLNLTGADLVIHFDPWWNPAVEEQATDRAHRIGQEKTVEVIKLLAKGTIEEKIYNLQQKKKQMINSVINEDMNEDNLLSQMTQEDLESLFS